MSITINKLHSQGQSILIVDDNPANLGVIVDYLETYGFKVLVARRGETGLEKAQFALPDLILLDVMMPGINGFETCRRLKEIEVTKDIPVIIMTALTDTEHKLKGFQAGAVDYITKPFQRKEVLARVQTHLNLRNLQKHLQEKNTQLQQAEAEILAAHHTLQEQNAQLQELNASKDKFFSIISHDLRSPFSTLLGLTEFVSTNFDKYDREKLRHHIDILFSSAQRLYALLENLLTWARLQRGAMQCEPEVFDLSGTIRENITIFASKADEKGITLREEIPENIMVYADVRMVDTIIRNLISNALKFTETGGNIVVSAVLQEQRVEMSVSDTGCGIDEAGIAKLFRIDTHYTHIGTAGEQGTGLGLILCKELVEQNGGRIWVESEVAKGTTFRFNIPRQLTEED